MNNLSVHAAAHHDVIYVVATTITGTEAALRFAVMFGQKRGARSTLVVPQLARTPASGDRARLAKPWLVGRYERMARTIDHRIQVLSCVSDSEVSAARQLTPACAFAVVGGRHRWWWPHQEERVAAALRRSGRHVVYVPETADLRPLLAQFDTLAVRG